MMISWNRNRNRNRNRVLVVVTILVLVIFVWNIYDAMNEEASTTHLKAASQRFVQENCNITGLSLDDWYPPTHSWRRRSPYFMLIGAKKTGTTTISGDWFTHPEIAKPRRKESLIFLPRQFLPELYYGDDGRVLVNKARQELLDPAFPTTALQSDDNQQITFDATPGLLYHSAIAPKAVFCVCAWTKIVILLRDPVARTFSNYNFNIMTMQRHGKKRIISFDEWVDEDLQELERIGFSNHRSTDELVRFIDSPEGRHAWALYTGNLKRRDRIVGRSLYGVQLRHWFQALRDVGRNPYTQVLIVRSEDLRNHRQSIQDRVFEFLDISPFVLDDPADKMVTKYENGSKPVLSSATKAKLEGFFKPFNEIVYDLLGGEWLDLWETNSNKTTTVISGDNIIAWPPLG